MTTILVWYLVTVSNARIVSYSPPLANVEDCKRLQETRPVRWAESSQCIELKMVKP